MPQPPDHLDGDIVERHRYCKQYHEHGIFYRHEETHYASNDDKKQAAATHETARYARNLPSFIVVLGIHEKTKDTVPELEHYEWHEESYYHETYIIVTILFGRNEIGIERHEQESHQLAAQVTYGIYAYVIYKFISSGFVAGINRHKKPRVSLFLFNMYFLPEGSAHIIKRTENEHHLRAL